MAGATPVVGISGPPGGAAFTTDFYLHPSPVEADSTNGHYALSSLRG